MNELRAIGYEQVIRCIHQRVGDRPAFVSFDIDFVDPSYAPGTGTPEVCGPTSYEALQLVRGPDKLDLLGFDLVEVLPSHDHSEITAGLAAAVAYEMISLIAWKKRRKTEC